MGSNAAVNLGFSVAIGAGLVWLAVLFRHEEQVKIFHFIQTGERFGCDCTWASPSETGQSWLFSVPWIKSLRTGEIYQYPLMG
jgi:hypothetical protein